jgi:putative endopeptidase
VSRLPSPRWPAFPVLAALAVTGFVVCSSGCDRNQAPAAAGDEKPAAATAAATPTTPELGSFGVDLAGMDKSVAPGDDFFAYVNGNWVKTFEIPADRSRYSSFTRLTELALQRTREIIEGAAADSAAGGDTRKIGDAYQAFMDESAIAARGLAPIQPQLDAVAKIADARQLSTVLGEQLRADVDLLNSTNFYTDRLFGLWVSQHLDDPTRTAPYLVQGGLGLPDRDYYLKGGDMAEMRGKYQAHVAKVLTLAGIADADAKAARIVALETAIARVHATQEQTNDIKAGANYWQRGEFATKAPGMDWDAFFTGANLSAQPDFVVWQPNAVAGISKLVAGQPLETWKQYLAFHALDRASPFLPKAFADENFAFYGTTLNGTPQQQDRWKRAINVVDGQLGEAVGKLYVDKYFTAETKARADAMVANLLAAFDHRIDALDWMSPQTKAQAKKKLAGMQVGMGYPSKWRDYSKLEIKRDDPLGNVQRAGLFEYQRNLAKLGKPVDRDEWYLLPQEVNALNVPLENRLIFPAAILGAPFFDPAADEAVNYGAIGTVIGHEITHSFDSAGALFDASGKLSNWWTPEDLKRFEAAGAALAAQYDAYAPFPDLHLNGKLTLGENIADVAGLATAYDAWKKSQEGKPAQDLEGFTPEQRFYLGFGQAWRAKAREQSLRNLILTNVHSPDQFRAQTVRNQDPWYDAFAVKPEQKLYLAPDKRVKVW